MVDLDVLWKKRGGRVEASRSLVAYALHCIKVRSTKSAGGRKVALLEVADVVNSALLEAFKSMPNPTDGEAFYFLIRRKLDNSLRTLEKSPKVIPMIPIVGGEAPQGTVSIDSVVNEDAEDPAATILADEEEARRREIADETKRRLKSPHCMEARLLDLIVSEFGDKQKICNLLKIDGPKFDRLKNTLTNIATAVRADAAKKIQR